MQFYEENTDEPIRYRTDSVNSYTINSEKSSSSCSESSPVVCVHKAHFMRKFDTTDTYDHRVYVDGPFWWMAYVWFHIEDTAEA